jgi:hypothetical protein
MGTFIPSQRGNPPDLYRFNLETLYDINLVGNRIDADALMANAISEASKTSFRVPNIGSTLSALRRFFKERRHPASPRQFGAQCRRIPL